MTKLAANNLFNPTMLMLARESRSLSQAELVDRVNMWAKDTLLTQSKLSRLEAGNSTIDDKIFTAISSVLNYPVNFFFKQARMSSISTRFFRKAKSMPRQTLRTILALIDIDRIRIESLLQSMELETKEIPQYEVDGSRFKSAASIARAVREFWHIPRGPIVDMTKLMEDAGIFIIPIRAGSRHFAGVHVPSEMGTPIVFVNDESPGDRLRFTLAHELGHIVMHTVTDDEGTSEDQADEFASEFLLPEAEIRPYLEDLTIEKAAALKMRWKVSMASIIYRANNLKCIDPNRSTELWTRMSKAGYRISEPRSTEIPKESPTLLREMIEMHQSVLGYNTEDLKKMLWLDDDSMVRFMINERPKLQLIRR
jgi:Zn-dependent peptidase ImmA (M78 family)